MVYLNLLDKYVQVFLPPWDVPNLEDEVQALAHSKNATHLDWPIAGSLPRSVCIAEILVCSVGLVHPLLVSPHSPYTKPRTVPIIGLPILCPPSINVKRAPNAKAEPLSRLHLNLPGGSSVVPFRLWPASCFSTLPQQELASGLRPKGVACPDLMLGPCELGGQILRCNHVPTCSLLKLVLYIDP